MINYASIAAIILVGLVKAQTLHALSDQPERTWPIQIPYEAPPKSQDVPDVSVPPNKNPLSPEELKRTEALLPLLEGKQEFWAMGEFVHLGEPAVPILVQALTMPSPRIRYNAIETLLMMKGVAWGTRPRLHGKGAWRNPSGEGTCAARCRSPGFNESD